MMVSAKQLIGARLHLPEGVAGQVTDLYFDDRTWVLRHFVVEPAGRGAVARAVLVAPAQVRLSSNNNDSSGLLATMSLQEFGRLPDASTARPVCKQYAWWSRMGGCPSHLAAAPRMDPHLRSGAVFLGYQIIGPTGAVWLADMIVDATGGWVIDHLVGGRTAGKGEGTSIETASVANISWATSLIRLHPPAPETLAARELIQEAA